MPGEPQSSESVRPKIGLALSGGGFRASIFHLGVIRRLEELGIMKYVAVVSSVSGGSIVAAYYIIEMERRLRERRAKIEQTPDLIDNVRLELFEEIAADFFTALDHNLRTRALIFSPFYHPLRFLKSLTPGLSRSDLIQGEYDRWFYHGNTLDQLPTVTQEKLQEKVPLLAGPKLILNTTSLMTGQRIGFSRVPISGINELKTVNKNVLPLSKIVGASACVPGLFPPVSVSGDLLVDGGVSDNQGVEGLIQNNCDILLVSDASGQMEQLHSLAPKAVNVISRTTAILQFQVRNKLLNLLQIWEKEGMGRTFVFINLFLSLKDRDIPCVPSEYIPGIARIRTDLDQFSFIEREALMYHGYTLIDAQVRSYCENLWKNSREKPGDVPDLKCPPLFRDQPSEEKQTPDAAEESGFLKHRERIKDVLGIGSQGMFLMRSLKKYPTRGGIVILLTWLIPLVTVYLTEVHKHFDWLTEHMSVPFLGWLQSFVPKWITWFFGTKLGFIQWPITPRGVTILLYVALLGYVLAFLTYLILRRLVRRWDMDQYKTITENQAPSTRW